MRDFGVHSNSARRPVRVTISDMSDALGLTKSTVSRALNGYSDISESTRLRVVRMAEKMGYRPLSHAQAIRTGRSRSIGFVIQVSDYDAYRPFLAEFLAGISTSASAEGWTLTVTAAEGDDEVLEKMRSLVADRKADGFIVTRSMCQDPRVDLLRASHVPFVLFGRSCTPTDCAWFDFLGEAAMHDAVYRLAALGHKRIAFLNSGHRYVYSLYRAEGFAQGMKDCGLEMDPALTVEEALTPESGYEATLEVMQNPEPPTAIVCAVDAAAMGVYRFARQAGLQIGRDLSVIGYDGSAEGASATPALSTYAVDIRRAGERLGALLIQRIRGEDITRLRETEVPTFLDRGSIGAPTKSPAELARVISQTNFVTQSDPNGRMENEADENLGAE